jgi:hypothetical protein
MDIANKRSAIMVVIALLWLTITVLGWKNLFLPAMILGVILMFLHMYLGAARKGKVSAKFFLYPLLTWAILWILSFSLSKYYSDAFAGQMPSFTILGFHPSFAWTVLTYWIGGMFSLTAGFLVMKNEWLSDEDWDEFLLKVHRNKEAA